MILILSSKDNQVQKLHGKGTFGLSKNGKRYHAKIQLSHYS